MRPLVIALAVIACAFGCTAEAEQRRDRCAKLNAELAECTGAGSDTLDCNAGADADQVSEADLDRLEAATSAVACSFVAGALPLDGDPKGATCRLFGVGCVEAVTPEPTPGATRYPVMLVNGIDSSPLFRYSDRIVSVMRDAGYDVHLATLPPYEPPRIRAPKLWERIGEVLEATGAEKVNLICHSLGGLDCRYLVSSGGAHWELGVSQGEIAGRVASITTIGTAHRGTRVADEILAVPTGETKTPSAADSFAGLVGDWFNGDAISEDVHLRDALAALSEGNAPAFNAEILDADGIYYQSWAGVSLPRGASTPEIEANVAAECGVAIPRHDWLALPLVPFVETLGKTTPTDGLIAVASAKWGNFRGCIPADHVEQLGQRNLPDANVQTGFDVARFYANVAVDLAARGF